MGEKSNKYLIVALLLGLILHGSLLFYTIESTYDALIHLFFGNHYSKRWFDPWSFSWYTGFTVQGYPPLVHQSIGFFYALTGELKFGLFTVGFIGIILFVTGSFRFSYMMTGNRKVAGYTAIVGMLSSSFIETLHVFGQLPSIVAIIMIARRVTNSGNMASLAWDGTIAVTTRPTRRFPTGSV